MKYFYNFIFINFNFNIFVMAAEFSSAINLVFFIITWFFRNHMIIQILSNISSSYHIIIIIIVPLNMFGNRDVTRTALNWNRDFVTL